MRTVISTVTLPDGLTLSYVEQGDRSGPALVLLPGPTDSWRSYEPILEAIPRSVRTIAVSQRGHGDSDKPNLSAAARAFAGFPFHDEEIAVAEKAGYFEAAGRYVPNLLNVLQQAMTHERPVTDDPAVLGAIKAPVAVLLGSDTKPFFTFSARYVVDHVANARVHEIRDVGHAAPVTHPEAVAKAITEFFAASPEVQLQL
jgi:pimeloyl-ACP methyl ester carboxylesterase